MKLQIIVIRDIVADVFLPPQFTMNLGSAIRSFADACKDKANQIGQHPEDYELYHLGEYDDQYAQFSGPDQREEIDPAHMKQIAIGKNFKE